MVLRKRRRTKEFDAGTDTLSRLLDSEQHLASQLDAAKADAEKLLREAREYASRAEAACESTIAARTASLAASFEQQLKNEVLRIQSDAALEASRFADPDPARTAALVAVLLEGIGAMAPGTKAAG